MSSTEDIVDTASANPDVEPREGSSLYYSLLRVEDGKRRRFLARAELGRVLADVLIDVREHDVARRKVHWWHEELERLRAGTPRHPAAVACDDLAGSDDAQAVMLELLGAAADERLSPSRTIDALDAALGRVGNARLHLLADALCPEADALASRPDWGTLGAGLARHERLVRLPTLLVREHGVFSDELYRRHGLTPTKLTAGVQREAPPADVDGFAREEGTVDDSSESADGDARLALLLDAVEIAERRIADGRKALRASASGSPGLRPLVVLAELRLRQLGLWRRRRPDLLRERLSLTPFRKAWIAMRVRS